MSFFDEADESRTPPRAQTRGAEPRRRRPSRGDGRPPTDQRAIQARRGVLVVFLLVIVVLIAIGVHSCQVSAANTALQNYSNNVAALITESNNTGARLFDVLSHTGGSANKGNVQNSVNETLSSATAQLARARKLGVPDAARAANSKLVLALQMRADAISDIATEIQPALGNQDSTDAINSIAAQMARLYASDVVYKDYTTTEIAAALHSAGIAVGGANGQQIVGGQFVPDVSWVTPSFVAAKLGVSTPTTQSGKIAAGIHGHRLISVSVAGATLQTGASNTIPASPAATFKLNFQNTGTNNETNVVCRVTVQGTNIVGQTVIPETFAGQPATCNVTLQSSPPKGTFTVVARIERVPGEMNIVRNSQSFQVTFQ